MCVEIMVGFYYFTTDLALKISSPIGADLRLTPCDLCELK